MIAPRITMLVAILATLAACSSTGGGSLSPSTEKMVASDRDESPNKPDATVQARCPSENTAAVTQYERYVRSSHYVEVRDGTLIAVDVYRPSGRGQLHETSLPAVWTYTPYLRALKGPAGNVVSSIDGPIGEAFCRAGYVHVVADVRGTGASYGIQKGIFTGEEAADVYDITEWIAGQVWCDGSVGMMGGSYAGVAQLMGATMKPPHLKAIFPAMALFDLYSFAYHGGVFFDKCLSLGDREQRLRNERTGRWVAPVDEDPERAMLGEARANHVRERGRSGLFDMFSPLPFRDSVDPYTNDRPYLEWGPSSRLKSLATCGIPVYIYAGWFDLFTRDAFLLYRNLKGPKRLRVVDSAHSQSNDELLGLFITEQIRWFDHWLKGINNGMADASPITVHRVDGSTDDILQLSDWPPPGVAGSRLYLSGGPSGSIQSANDGLLGLSLTGEDRAADTYAVDYTTSSGPGSRWLNGARAPFEYPDMMKNDTKSLTYTTRVLTKGCTVLGHPVVTLWIGTPAPDIDLFVYLEDVSENGSSRYATEGAVRASQRRLSEPPFDGFGLPYHSGLHDDVEPITPETPIEIVLDLQPIFYRFAPGHRIRLVIAGADADNAAVLPAAPPGVNVFRGAAYPSSVTLPLWEGIKQDMKKCHFRGV